jgi:chemotaxis protein histidine kinase CheA
VTQEGAPLDEVSFSDFLDDYYAECDEHLMGARRLLLALETSIGRDAVNRTVLDELFRHFHSLKGISGMVELRAAEELAHRLEDYLRVLRTGDTVLSRDGLDALFDGTETLEQVIAARRAPRRAARGADQRAAGRPRYHAGRGGSGAALADPLHPVAGTGRAWHPRRCDPQAAGERRRDSRRDAASHA